MTFWRGRLPGAVKVGDSATDPAPKVTSYTYTPRSEQLRQTKANGNTVDFTYWPSGEVHTQTEKTSTGSLVDSHTLSWDPNGNKAEDVASKQNADNHTAYLNSTTDYTYDPVDRLAQSVKTGNGATTETYVHDDNDNVISQTVQGTATTYTYDRNRLLSSASGGATASYNYDPYGRLDTVTSGGTVVERNTYDGFDHVVKNTKAGSGGTSTTTSYTFDPLDRTTSETANGKTTDYAYLGLTNQVLDETVAGQLTKSYQYSPWGERLSQVTHNSDGTTSDGFYGYNSHTDVETVTDDSGQTKATYRYTAYGSNDSSEFTGIDKPDTADPTKEPYNAYRFNAKRRDQASGTYDMGFRTYDPGLNTFTTRDMYDGALADMNLSTNPLTGNRYAFAGGNPTINIELDRHRLDDCFDECLRQFAAAMSRYAEKMVKQAARAEFFKQLREWGVEHDAVVVATIANLNRTPEYDAVGGRLITATRKFNCVKGGSLDNPGNDKICGYPDIMLHAKNGKVYVREVKAAASAPDAFKQVNQYITSLTARGDTAELGWDLPPISAKAKGIDAIYSAPHISPPPTGVVLYDRTPKPEPKAVPEPEPKTVPQEQPESRWNKFKDWWHENIKMPDPDNNPFKLPGIPVYPLPA